MKLDSINPILKNDLEHIFNSLNTMQKNAFKDSTILMTGAAGFLGFEMLHFFSFYANTLGIKKIIALDNFMLRQPQWLQNLKNVEIYKFDIIKDKLDSINNAKEANFIIHAASIASPSFYRSYPIETLDANIWGLRALLDFYVDKGIKGFLFFSSSEIYGDPDSKFIPTSEEYRGNVACIGPRACYDESKRFGETMCYLYAQKYNMPLTIVRPFNNYGLGMNLQDKRVPADFANACVTKSDINILSDGSPKRTFCYIADAISGYIKALSYGRFDYFNIGIDTPEISILELAHIYAKNAEKILNFKPKINFAKSSDKNYLVDNPNRRCPIIKKAKTLLDYNPQILVEQGVSRFLEYLKLDSIESKGGEK
ncbi:NAD-dependent epimerase/dehydratase family protein [Helicobacter saguini]|uniref:NAD-dependent epimerase/dehydratase family protein n=1 Tax=Helicobacter saguini TaxID=1548018 RepID=A0A347VSI6_9HELI|nr:NAD-dependent epimerase/dehydratase family protein [Helicobacter saguini]MWV62490.1 NAD-dependent epimerase/dehydratase family protein [Helicobacter saguini]MWV66837.1 NAD-dependent epimerase/dehydratase family protein [Helicobacter saguini]MWV69187.1 NAD-dependent epimerase/dehydratase family protein [Helicobacter saguini]MWV71258.1 NAD-dependent epimerase/dehydratase family protein [Helicobacter saguini]TLD94223.1 NAD-dependent epimerase/dehydratase family protein [Helicobacter saguini]